MKSLTKIKLAIAVAVVVPAIVLVSWVVTDSIVHATSGEEFCGGCHTMTPMVKSYREDVHGGAGDKGVKAKCTQCHQYGREGEAVGPALSGISKRFSKFLEK